MRTYWSDGSFTDTEGDVRVTTFPRERFDEYSVEDDEWVPVGVELVTTYVSGGDTT